MGCIIKSVVGTSKYSRGDRPTGVVNEICDASNRSAYQLVNEALCAAPSTPLMCLRKEVMQHLFMPGE